MRCHQGVLSPPGGALLLAAVLLLIGIPGIARAAVAPVEILYEDQADPGCVQYGRPADGQGLDGGQAIQLLPDPWHRPTLKLYCAGGARRDFRPYDVLQFFYRNPSADPGEPTFYLRTWNAVGRTVAIRDYIAGRIIDGTWRLVVIPLADLATPEWDLGDVEALVWGKDSQKRTSYVDRIQLRQVNPPSLVTTGDQGPFWESDSVLRLTFTKRCDADTVRGPDHYFLRSDTDPAYGAGSFPETVGIQYRVERFSSTGAPEVRYQVFLGLAQPVRNGNSYLLTVKGIADEAGNVMAPAAVRLSYNDREILNPNLKVNQVGYHTNGPKVGYFGGYLGDLGGGAWAVGESGTLLAWREPAGWRRIDLPTEKTLRAVAAVREDEVWAVGDAGTILRGNGDTWTPEASPSSQDLLALHFGPTGIGWAVGSGGTALRYEHGTWVQVPTPTTQTLRGVWAGPGDTAWAVGDRGTILVWNGSEWVADETPTSGDLLAIHGPHGDWLWAAGESGTVLLRRYGHWKAFSGNPGTSATLRAVMTDPSGQVWIGGENGLLWHKPGFGNSAFVAEPSGTTASINALGRQHGRRLLGVGEGGQVIVCSGEGWRAEPSPVQDRLLGVFALPYGALRLPEPPPNVTIREVGSGAAAFSAPLRLEARNWHLSGEDVYSFDFTPLKTPGTYQAYLPGIGLSTPFEIGSDALRKAAKTAARGLYYQRCGTALTAPFAETRFARPLDHEFEASGRKVDAVFHPSLTVSPLYAGEVPGGAVDAHGGWHDAGDYGKYLPTAAAALWYLFTAYDLNAVKFADGAWNIPESGNGVPDLLDEARWEVDWILRMQAPDGGIYHKLTAETWFEGMPHEEVGPRYVFAKTTHDTASGAAVLAAAARLWAPYDATLAATYLERAELAWSFLQRRPEALPSGGFRNPPGTVTGEYNDSDDGDNRLWAAAELYRTTGGSDYRLYFETWWATHAHDWGWNDWQHFQRCAYWAYLRSPWPDGDSIIKRDIRNHILNDAREVVSLTDQNPYRNGARLDVPDWIGWGAFTQSSEYAFPLLQAWALSPDPDFLRAALLNLDTQLGANPLSRSFVTGLGSRPPADPLHMVALHDGVDDPIPGIPVFGAAAHLSDDNPFNAASQADANNFPHRLRVSDPYPILRRYIDAHELVAMSEFTVVHMAATAGVYGLLADDPCGR